MTTTPTPHRSVLLRVLVADAGVFFNASLMALLSESEGISVFGCAQEPAKILALVRTTHPDIVIFDLITAGPLGLKTLTEIKRVHDAPAVVVLSDYDMSPLREAAVAAGADLFLIKATECGLLQEWIHDVLRARQRACARTEVGHG
jgi:DNA-binding NarL/FixJ family response regulator